MSVRVEKTKYSPGWRLKYYFEGREKLLSLGTYPDVSLKRARERRDEVRQLVLDGIDPSAERKAKKLALADSFESIAREWLGKQTNLSDATRLRDTGRLERFAFSQIGGDQYRRSRRQTCCQYGATVLLVAHAGHGDAKRPRGASVLMANPDAEYIVERQGMSVTVSRERFKDCESLPALAYEARSVDLGRTDEEGQPVTSLVLAASEAPAPAAKARATGTNQQAALIALREWARANPSSLVIPSGDMGALLKRQGIGPKRKPEVLVWLTNAGFITPSIDGHIVNRDAV